MTLKGCTRLLPSLLMSLALLLLAAAEASAQAGRAAHLAPQAKQEKDAASHILKKTDADAETVADDDEAAQEVALVKGGSLALGAGRSFDDFIKGEARDERGGAEVEADGSDAPETQAGGSGQQTPAPSSSPTYTPLTPGQKMRRAFKSAFLDPTGYAVAAFTAGLTQLGEDRLPHKDTEDELADWGSRTARNFGRLATRRISVVGVYPVIFKQDPRYERSTKTGFGAKALHAISRVFVTRGDNGNLQPNWSRFAGTATAHGLANLWEHSTPGHDRIGWDATLRRIPRSLAFDMLNNIIFKELLPDLF